MCVWPEAESGGVKRSGGPARRLGATAGASAAAAWGLGKEHRGSSCTAATASDHYLVRFKGGAEPRRRKDTARALTAL